jgi:small neutral amino acid transporter SnatA (MarC family)
LATRRRDKGDSAVLLSSLLAGTSAARRSKTEVPMSNFVVFFPVFFFFFGRFFLTLFLFGVFVFSFSFGYLVFGGSADRDRARASRHA